MKKVKDQLKTIAKSLLSLSMKVEKITEKVDALRSVKPAPAAKKAMAKKAVAKKAVAKKAVAKKTAIKKAVAKKAVTKKTPAKKVVAKKAVTKKTSSKKAAKKKTPAKKAAPTKQLTVQDAVFDTIKRTKKGVTVAQLKEKLDLNAKQLSNTLYKLSKKGKIEAKSRGLYFKK